ncbi:MAG: restriction endonuclease [Pyrinomonadaceae bacterium]
MKKFESLLVGDENVTITSPKRLLDKVTKRLREHDVVIEIKKAHHTNVLAFECRDRSRPIDVNAVEAFAKKCENTGVDKPIMVSSSGFTGPAREKADFYGIECFDLEQMTEMVVHGIVVGCSTILFNTIESPQIHWNFIAADGLSRNEGEWGLVNSDGECINPGIFNQQALNELNRVPESTMAGSHRVSIGFPTENVCIRVVETGEIIEIVQAIATVQFVVRRDEVPIERFKYSRNNGQSDIAGFALGRQTIQGKELSLVFTAPDNGPVTLSLHLAQDDSAEGKS